MYKRQAGAYGRYLDSATGAGMEAKGKEEWMQEYKSKKVAELEKTANVALGLFGAILFSTTYIFGLEGAWLDHVWTLSLIHI